MIVVIPLGIAASFALNRRFSAQAYQRTYRRKLQRKWSVAWALAVWLYAALLVGLIIAFPSIWWLSLLVTSVVVYGVIAVLIFRDQTKLQG